MIKHRRSRPRGATLKLTAAFAFVSLSAAPSALAAPGDLDSTFGTGGISLAPLGTDDYVRDVALQPDGKSVAGGTSWDGTRYRFALARYNADGSLDPTFGSGGKVLTNVGTSAAIYGVALQSDGRIVVAGRAYNAGAPNIAVGRYNANGTLDTSFSGDGLVTTAIGSESSGWDVGLEPDGRINVAGHAQVTGSDRIALARFTTAGALDSSFGAGGTRTTQLGSGSYALSLARLSDGKLVVAGGAEQSGVTRVAVARYSSTGTLDTSFGSSGSTITPVGTGAAAQSVLVDSSGRLVVAGTAADAGIQKALVARYSSAGALDSTFGTGGVTLAQVGASWLGAGLAQQADGRLVVAGDSTTGTNHSFAVTRVNTDGSLDSSFGSGGSVTTAIGTKSGAAAVAVQADGLILAAGTGGVGAGARQFALARYKAVADPPPPPADDPPADDPPVDDPPVDDPPVDDPPVDDPPVDDPPVDDPPVDDPPVDDPPVDDPPVDDPPVDDLPVDDPPADDPPVSDPPVTDPPASDPPASDPPVITPPPTETGTGGPKQITPVDELGLLPPDVKPIYMPQQSFKLQGTNLLPVRLKCIELPTYSCKGTVVITAPIAALGVKGGGRKGKLSSARRRKTKMVRIARKSVTIPSGETVTAKLVLNSAAKRALAANGSLRVEVEASVEVNGTIRAARRTFTLRSPKKKSKRTKSRR